MKRIITSLLAALATAIAAFAYEPAIRDIDIVVKIQHDGTISIHERWDVTAASGTEWYLVRNNLADIRIRNFVVSENGRDFVNEGEWDVDRGINAKAHRCGIVTKSNGAELCWGVGSYGDHVFDVYYDMTNAVKSLQDYDMLHMQFVGTGLSSTPEHVKVSVEIPDVQIDTSNARLWGFGYEGMANFIDGKCVFESTERFQYMSSIISLIRLDKGILEPTSIQDRPFQDALDTALEGAYFGTPDDDEEDDFWATLGAWGILGYIFWRIFKGGKSVSRKQQRAILGVDPKSVGWTRDVPFKGDLLKAEYTLKKLGQSFGDSNYSSALILRLVQKGYMVPRPNGSKMDLLLTTKDTSTLDDVDLMFFTYLKEAARNNVLEESEFSRWASNHTTSLKRWSNKLTSDAMSSMVASKYLDNLHKYTESGQLEARNTLGFKMFLKDFTLVKERTTPEVTLWQDYLAFGALYGIADQVARELKEINPDMFKQVVSAGTVSYDFDSLVRTSRRYREIVRDNQYSSTSSSYGSSSSYGGFGGSSSFGGGGGFSGGGHGGGSR